jgi:hypothetical protein
MDDTGAYLRFTCPYDRNVAKMSLIVLGLVYMILPISWVGYLFLSTLKDFNQISIWLIVGIGLFLLPILVYFEGMVVEFFWHLSGKEVMEISQDGIVMRHQIFGFGISQQYRTDKLNGVFVPSYRDKKDWLYILVYDRYRYLYSNFVQFKDGKVAFNYGRNWLIGGPATFRFGTGIGWHESTQIVAMIHNRFPQYQFKQSKPVS